MKSQLITTKSSKVVCMRAWFLVFGVIVFLSCSSNVRFVRTAGDYAVSPKPASRYIVFTEDKIQRPHKVIGIIHAELGKKARRAVLNDLLLKKAHEIGADGLMLVEYNVQRSDYLEDNHSIIGRGPALRDMLDQNPQHVVKKTASAIAVVFKPGEDEG